MDRGKQRILPDGTLRATSASGALMQAGPGWKSNGDAENPMRSTFLSLLTLLTALAATVAPAPAQEAERYNLISIVTDDQGAWTLGAYGNKESRTPNMDRICREGARFTNAFVATPVCSPSRASFLTGLYSTQAGVTDWISPAEANAGHGLPAKTTTWPEVLQKHGYRTGLIGKWHLGSQPQYHPSKHGLDHFYGFLGGGTRPVRPVYDLEDGSRALPGPEPDVATDEALRFVEANRARPFALLLHFRAPHLPYRPVPDEDAAPFRDLDPTIPEAPGLDAQQVKRWTRDYYASVHSVDRNLGRLLAKLDNLNLSRKTIVLFTSDHGYNVGHHGIHTKGNGFWIAGGVQGPKRPNMWDTSLRVPLGIRWPGVVKPGTEIAEMVSNVDTFAGVLGMLNVPVPAGVKQEGMDFSSLLRGRDGRWRNAVYGQYDLHNGGLAYMRMIRTPEWKLVRHYRQNGMDELYHLAEDPGETRNLYGNAQHRKIREELQERLTAWMRGIHDPLAEEGLVRLTRAGKGDRP